MKEIALFFLLACTLCCLNACGGGEAHPETKPTVTISASPSTVTVNGSVTLTWSSTNATSCTASASPSESDWSGQVTTNGSQPVTPVSVGTITYSLQCSGTGGSASESAPVTANVARLSIEFASLPQGTVGQRYNPQGHPCGNNFCWTYGFKLNAAGGISPYSWSWTPAAGSSLPTGLDLAGDRIGGIPRIAGTYHVAVAVTDSQSPPASTTASYSITISNPAPPVIKTALPPAGALNLPYAFTFAAHGYAPLTWSESGAVPPGLAFATDGTLAGTPNKLGAYPISVTAMDAVGQVSAPYNVTIEVFPHGFKAASSMTTTRTGHTATLLTNGKVLVTGGVDANGLVLATAELFDPASGNFVSTGSLGTMRTGHTATLLNNGKVLVTGGTDRSGVWATAELFDPATGSLASTGSMATGRTGHTATLLNNGKVLVAGGAEVSGSTLATAELFDPTSGSFAPAGSMATARIGHTATLLADGRVLVAGGQDNLSPTTFATAELFDPTSGSFAPAGSMATARISHTATLLADGRVLVAGGQDNLSATTFATAELFDPTSGNFASLGSMTTTRTGHTATLLRDGGVLVAGGLDISPTTLATAELFDPASGSFTSTGSMTTARTGHTATLLSDGHVLVTGGTNGSGTSAAAELYQ
jgi:Galactose oxidase, central domain